MERLKNLGTQLSSHPLKYFGISSLIKPEHQAILDTIESFCQKHLNTQKYLQYYERGEFPDYLLPQLRKLQIGRYLVPPPEGIIMPMIVQGLMIAAFAAHDLSISTFLFLQLSLSVKNIIQLGSPQQRKKYVNDLIEFKKICGWALTERETGSNSTRLSTTYKKDGDKIILNGNKRWIGNGDRDLLIVFGNVEGQKRIIGALIQGKTKGITQNKIENKYSFRLVQNCQIEFDNVVLDQSNLLPGATSYKAAVETTLKYSRIIIIWNTVGSAIGVFQHTLRIAKNRKETTVIDQQKIGRIMGQVQGMLFCAWRITEIAQMGDIQTPIVGMFKAYATSRARAIFMLAREVMGYQQDARLLKALLDLQVAYTYQGTYDINALLAGSHLTGLKAFT